MTEHIETGPQYSVYQFFNDEGTEYERVLYFVEPEIAVERACRLVQSVGAKLGLTRRVMITDGLDFCVFDWQHSKGIVHPPLETLKKWGEE